VIVAIMSDVHDNLWHLARMLREVALAEALVYCGDFCAPFTLDELASHFAQRIYAVFGNNDGDKLLMSTVASRHRNVTILGDFGEITLGGRLVAVTHTPQIAKALAAGGRYDLVCSGHTHKDKVEQVGNTLWVNPGEVMGRFGEACSALYDTEKHAVEFCRLAVTPVEW